MLFGGRRAAGGTKRKDAYVLSHPLSPHSKTTLIATLPPATHHCAPPLNSCSGPIPDFCTAERDYGGCWRANVGGRLRHACVDNLRMYR